MKGDAGSRLLAWFLRHRRDLPWRHGTGPYEVLVSEIMLQQTRVDTVIPYYRRFLAAFPSVEALATAPEEEVLARWSGLGYYRRARMLHATAREVRARGGFPTTADELAELPGIGPYTAAAVASIAFGEAVPVVDGNVERVASRLLALAEDPKRGAARRRVIELSRSLLQAGRAGDSNQAIMELGALVCRPKAPRCGVCPLHDDCRGRKAGVAAELPRRPTQARTVLERRVVAVVENEGRFLLFCNPATSRQLAGLWEFPSVVRGRSRAGWERDLASAFGGRWRVGRRLGEARHGITVRRLVLAVHRAKLDAGEIAEGPECRWLLPEEISAVPTTSMVAKVLKQVAASLGT